MAKNSGPPVTDSPSRKTGLMRPWQQMEHPLADEDSEEPDQGGYIVVAFLGVFYLVVRVIFLIRGGL
jgi:hypothetical protein